MVSELFGKFASRFRSCKQEKEKDLSWTGVLDKNTPIRKCPFVVFDTELSGLDVKNDFIVSIGAIKMTGGTIHVGQEFYRLIRPVGEMSKESVEIHGIVPSELRDQDNLDSILPKFLDFIKDSLLVGHFVHIDLKFLNAALRHRGHGKLSNPAVDTSNIHNWLYENGEKFRRHYPGASEKTDLFSIARRYGISIEAMHNSLYDAYITAQLFQRFLHFLHAEGMRSLRDLIDIGRA